MFHARQGMPKQQRVARAFSKHIKPACIHDHENNKSTEKCREWWVMVNICIPHRGNGETATLPLHWCHTTWRFMLLQKLFFGGTGSCRERWSWQLFSWPFNVMPFISQSVVCASAFRTNKQASFRTAGTFSLPTVSTQGSTQKADYVLFGDAR